MKRSKMLENIQEELKDAIKHYLNSSSKAKPHVLRYQASNILDMIERFGMLPPLKEDSSWVEIDGTLKRIENEWDEEET